MYGPFSIVRLIVFELLARLGLRINCEVVSQPCPQGGSSEMAASSQEVEEGIQETDALSVRSRKRRTGGSWGLPTGDDVLNLAAKRYLQEPEGSNGFVRYLTCKLKVVLVDVKTGSLIITVECSSSKILQELWQDYLAGHVNEKAHTFLATKEVLNELGLTEVKFTTKIPKEEYESGRKKFLDIESSKCHYFYKYVFSVPLPDQNVFFTYLVGRFSCCRGLSIRPTIPAGFNFY